MYKVFLNDRSILIDGADKVTINSSSIFFGPAATAETVEKRFLEFENESRRKKFFYSFNPEELFEMFQSRFLNVKAAGGVIRHQDRILFIFRNEKWDLPKGKIDPGESPEEAALREVREETGLKRHQIIKPLPSTWHIYPSPHEKPKQRWILKETFWYEMEVPEMEALQLQQEEGITKAEWIPVGKMNKVLRNTYKSLKDMIESYRP